MELGEVRAEFGKRREERKKGETSYVTNTKLVLYKLVSVCWRGWSCMHLGKISCPDSIAGVSERIWITRFLL